jgi:hypothetical protein
MPIDHPSLLQLVRIIRAGKIFGLHSHEAAGMSRSTFARKLIQLRDCGVEIDRKGNHRRGTPNTRPWRIVRLGSLRGLRK